MALHWDLSKVQDADTLCWVTDPKSKKERMNKVTETLIGLLLAIGIGRITEKNALQVLARIKVIEKMYGAHLYTFENDQPKDRFYTWDDIKAHIGLTTNVSDETDAKFLKRHAQGLLQTCTWKAQEERTNCEAKTEANQRAEAKA